MMMDNSFHLLGNSHEERTVSSINSARKTKGTCKTDEKKKKKDLNFRAKPIQLTEENRKTESTLHVLKLGTSFLNIIKASNRNRKIGQ